jgi:hypothetical protein
LARNRSIHENYRDLMIQRPRLQQQILAILIEDGPTRFGSLKRKLGIKSVSFAYYHLKKLLKDQLIDEKMGQYELTSRGWVFIRTGHLTKPSQSVGYKEHAQVKTDLKGLNVEPLLADPIFEINQRIPLETILIGEACNTKISLQRLVEKIDTGLNTLSSYLARQFAEEVAWTKGIGQIGHPSVLGVFSFCEQLEWIKEAYDYNFELILHFNPRKMIECLPWERILKKAELMDKKVKEGSQIWSEKLEEAFKNDEKILEDYIRDLLGFMATETYEASSKADFLSKIADKISHDPLIRGKVPKNKVETIIRKILETGRFKVGSITRYSIIDENKIATSGPLNASLE